MKTDFNLHLYGIFRTLQSRFDLINNSIGHSATKGAENEKEIKKLLVDFLPAQFGISDGIIVDVEGNESKQIDIIVYDKSLPNYSLGSDSKIFLIDTVIATIEIKTTYTTGTNSSLKESIENVRRLKILKSSKNKWIETEHSLDENKVPVFSWKEYNPHPPVSIVFFYTVPENKSAIDLDQFKESVKTELNNIDKKFHPDLIFSMAHSAFFWYDDISKIGTGKFNFYPLNLSDTPNNPLIFNGIDNTYKALYLFGKVEIKDGTSYNTKVIEDKIGKTKILILEGENIGTENLIYKTCKVGNKILFLDSYRAFIGFIAQIDALTRLKKTNKSIFISEYFHGTFFEAAKFDDELKIE